MRLSARGWIWAVTWALAGCQDSASQSEQAVTMAASPTATASPGPQDPPASPIDWAGAGDCLGQLRLLHTAAREGRLNARHEPPFAVLQAASTTGLEWTQAAPVPLVADLPLPFSENRGAAAAAAPCLLLVEPAREIRAASRVIGFEEVASAYQSSVRSEKNPDYEAAQERVREARRDTGESGPGVLRVGDPMLDLVGLLVGGVIATFGQIGDDDVDDALAELKETPRSRDRPVYRAYAFERSTVRAGKEAIVAVELRDVRRGRVWRSQLRQREMRELAVLEGLDPRDRDYEQHRAGAMSWREFEHWQRQPPQLPLSALVAALIEPGGSVVPPRTGDAELVAGVPSGLEPAAGGPSAATPPGPARRPRARMPGPAQATAAEMAPEAWGSRQVGAPSDPDGLTTAHDPRVASLVRLDAGRRSGNGFYVEPRLVVTAADVVGTASVIDVTTSDGEAVLGLVVLTDPIRNLAVVHVPRAGQPMPVAEAAMGPSRRVQVIDLARDGRARIVNGSWPRLIRITFTSPR
jgi:hypothetical protein